MISFVTTHLSNVTFSSLQEEQLREVILVKSLCYSVLFLITLDWADLPEAQ